MQEILEKVQVHVPFALLREKLLPMVIRERIRPEIGFGHLDLDRFGKSDFREAALRLADAGLSVTFHAPFMDLRPGALDPRIRQASLDRLRGVFDLIPWFRPRTVVCHPSFDERYYVASEQSWLANSLETWRHLREHVRGTDTVIALENVYERSPHPLRLLLDSLDVPEFCFCFDTGHFNAFAGAPLTEWMESLGGRLGEIHLHDNRGHADEHLPVGEGSFPFDALLEILRERNLRPILTIESHSEKDLRRMLENIRSMKLLERMEGLSNPSRT